MGARTQDTLDERQRKLGVGGGEYAVKHTARADRWYVVGGIFREPPPQPGVKMPALGPFYERVSAFNASFAAIAAERSIRKILGASLVRGETWTTTSVAEEIFRREL